MSFQTRSTQSFDSDVSCGAGDVLGGEELGGDVLGGTPPGQSAGGGGGGEGGGELVHGYDAVALARWLGRDKRLPLTSHAVSDEDAQVLVYLRQCIN